MKYVSNLRSYLLPIYLLALIVTALANTSQAQVTVYIDPSYTGSQQNGTIQYPYKSWTSVTWTNGYTYLQKAGTTYTSSGSLIITSRNNITLGSYGTGNKPKVVSTGATTVKVIDITSCYNMVVSGLEVYSTNGQVTAAIIIDGTGSGNNLIDNCVLHDTQWGIRILTTSAGNRILNCQVYNTQDDGIYIKDTPDIEIGYCNIYNVNLKYFVNPDQSYSAGDNIQIASTNSHNFYVHHNTLDHSSTGNKFCFIAWGNNYTGILEHNTMIGNSTQVTSCIYLSPTTGTVTVRYNAIKNGNYGIYSYVANFQVYYNKFVSNRNAISVQNNYHLRAENNVFYNNTITAISTLSGSNTTSKNNIFYISGSAKAYNANGTIISNYNTFNTQYANFINGYSTLAGWRSASGQDVNSMVANPSFVNPSAGDFTLQANSPCINAGTLCGYTQDFFGNSVPSGSTSDIGFFELVTSSNNPPLIQNQTFTIPENSPVSTVVGQVIASDPNAGQTITFTITAGNPSNTFNIHPTTGYITVSNPQTLNYENTPVFTLQVTVTDNLNASSTATITINLQNINENPFSGDQGFLINENPANGTAVGTITATDPDQGQTLTFTILQGNSSGAFTLESSTGILRVANNQHINYEINPSFTLSVKVQDNGAGSLSDTSIVTISVGNVNEAPVVSNQTYSINSNSTNGTIVGTVIATDPDLNQALNYVITNGNTNNVFTINNVTGIISITNSNYLLNSGNPFNLGISVSDNGNPVLSTNCIATIIVAQSNQAPVISNQSFTIAENSAAGTTVGQVIATDSYGQILSYTIVSGNSSGAFSLSSSGLLTVANSSVLNYESTPIFNIGVIVSDNGTPALSSQATITIFLTNVNEAPYVVAGQYFTTNSSTPVGTVVGTVQRVEPDQNQTTQYQIIDGDPTGAFAIGSYTGILTVANSVELKKLANKTLKLRIRVTDNGSPVLSSSDLITIKVFRRKDVSFEKDSLELAMSLNVYPNPSADGIFYLNFDGASDGPMSIIVTDLSGRVMENTQLTTYGNQMIDLSNLPKGIYLMQLRKDSMMEIKKLVIQ
jgi:hypothetical protein